MGAGETRDDGQPGVPRAELRGVQPSVARRLPQPYRAALAGVAAGDDDLALAASAGVHPAAVPALVRLALAKLLAAQSDVGSAGNA